MRILTAINGDSLQKEIGRRITDRRKKKNISQKQLADMLGTSLRTVQRYENGEIDITLSAVIRISEILDITPMYLLNFQPALFDDLSPAAQDILVRWGRQADNALRTMTAAELTNCTESDLQLLRLILDLKAKQFANVKKLEDEKLW